jgi:hypothetical protein
VNTDIDMTDAPPRRTWAPEMDPATANLYKAFEALLDAQSVNGANFISVEERQRIKAILHQGDGERPPLRGIHDETGQTDYEVKS